jgi:hypothetical protein
MAKNENFGLQRRAGPEQPKVEPITAPVHSDAEIETAIIALGREPGGGLVVMPDGSWARIARQS